MSWKLRRFREVAIDQLSTLFLYFLIYDVNIYIYTDKNAEVATSLLTSCNKPISGCVRMACDSLLTTSLLQVVNRQLDYNELF